MEKIIEKQLLVATDILEQQCDSKLEQLDKMDENDFDVLRLKRLENIKKLQKQKQEWIQNSHGKYEEIDNESEFFSASKKSSNFICHFYRTSTSYCQVVDKHLAILATKHLETRFVKINAERCKFLVDKLRIKIMPTICLAKNSKIVDYIIGFDDLGGKEDFSTDILEWRIARADILNYEGDLMLAPKTHSHNFFSIRPQKIIKESNSNKSDDEDNGY